MVMNTHIHSGGMSPYDSLDLPKSLTMLTSGGGSTNRSTHLLKIDGRYRLLTRQVKLNAYKISQMTGLNIN